MDKNFSRQEIRLIATFDTIQWVARDSNNVLYGYFSEPHKEKNTWTDDSHIRFELKTNLPFECIKWEDNEPTSRHDILYGLINHNKFFTEEEKQLIKLLDEINWLCRDKFGLLLGFSLKPFKRDDRWISQVGKGFMLPTSLNFDAVLWSDYEPINRKEILGEC